MWQPPFLLAPASIPLPSLESLDCQILLGISASRLMVNKYGSVQELRSTLGHFKSFKILGWLQFGLVGLVWVSLVGKIWLGWLNRFGLVKFVKVGFLLLRSDPFINFLSLDCLVLVWFGLGEFGW